MNGKAYEVQLLKGQPIENSVRGEKVDTFVGTLKFGELSAGIRSRSGSMLTTRGISEN